MTAVRILEEGVWVVGVGTLVLLAPWLPNPLGYAAAMLAIILGPGHGLPGAIFRARTLTFPERLLFTVLLGIAIIVTPTYALIKLGVPLDQRSVGTLVILLTTLSSAVSLLMHAREGRRSERPKASMARWRRAAFGSGVLLGVVCGAIAWRVLGP